ncbi:MAG: AAA family ATPase [Rhodospirillaceae bacterium]
MEIRELVLERYGIFQDFRLDFGAGGPRLHIIHGANEAGKSTALSAVCDLLFGIPERTTYGFLHGNPNLLIGATLANRAGETLTCRRRKGRINTLLDASGAPLPDGVLPPWLGGVTREAFERMFALDHQRLRDGGNQMLEAEGDLARSLFQAGSGLPNIMSVLARLNAEAEALGSPRRKSAGKPLWRGLGDYEEAQQRVRREALRVDEWTQAVDSRQQAETTLAEAKRRLDALRQERIRITRTLRVLPLLARLDSLTAQAATLSDAPELPPDFADRWRAGQSRVESAATESRRLAGESAEQHRLLAGLPEPGPLPDHREEIERLFRDSGDIANKRKDLPKLERDLEHSDDRLAQFVVRLGGGVGRGEVEHRRPSQPLAVRVRDRISERNALTVAWEKAVRQAEAARDRLRETEDALAAIGTPPDPAQAITAWEEGLAAGDVEGRLTAAEAACRQAGAKAAALLARLPGWSGSLERLTATAFPAAATVQRLMTAQETAEADRRRAAEARDTAIGELQRTEGDLNDLQAAGEVPTPEALAVARRQRDQGWRLIRSAYIDRTLEPGQAALDYADPGGDLASRYEAAVRHADGLVDLRERDAHRIQRYLTLQRQREDSRAEEAKLTARLDELDHSLAGRRQAWRALWQPVGLEPGQPADMLEWLRGKDEVLREAETVLKREQDLDVLRRQAEAARQLFFQSGRALGLTGLDGLELPALRARVRSEVERAAEAWAARRRLETEMARGRRECERAERDLGAARDGIDRWSGAWAEDMPAIGLSPAASPAEAGAALDVWTLIETELTDRRQRQERLRGIRADLEAHEQAVRSLTALIGDALTGDDRGLPPLDLPPLLYQRWKAAEERLKNRTVMTEQIAGLDAALALARRQEEEARRRLDLLRRSYGLAEDADPLAEAARGRDRAAVRERLAEAGRDLAAAGEGRSETELREEARDIDSDALAVRVLGMGDEEARALTAFQTATEAANDARRTSDGLLRREGIGEAAQAARDAALVTADLTARYVRLWAAQSILATAIERFRAANEQPLLRRASELFAAIAASGGNPILRLIVDYGDRDRPVLVGVRRDDSRCHVESMSDGTRDQLYLTLRIAAVEAAAREGEPMPFIADDLFITSDDERTAPGLKALAELGRQTQVLLFTHHRTVVETATATLDPRLLRTHSLAPRQGPGAAWPR